MKSISNILILIDYDNLTEIQKKNDIHDLIISILNVFPFPIQAAKCGCTVRLYGGWYEQEMMTKSAQDLSTKLQESFPNVLKRFDGKTTFQISAELALSMLQDPGTLIFHTFRRKGHPNNIRVANQIEIGCVESKCTLPLIKSILTKGRCSVTDCTKTESLIYRAEQKLVDTMLTCDLIHSSKEFDSVILVSDDDDFVPPLKVVSMSGFPIVRIHPKSNNKRIEILKKTSNYQETEL